MPADILCTVGLPALHKGVLYNCMALLLNQQVIALRPKVMMCEEINYYESRVFTGWPACRAVEDFSLPDCVRQIKGQLSCKIGVIMLQTLDAAIGFEICEESWQEATMGMQYRQAGAEIILNSSASHAAAGKISKKIHLFQELNSKLGSFYVYSNIVGTDGGRLYYDGQCFVLANNRLIARSEPFNLDPCQLLVARLDLAEIRSFRSIRKYKKL